MLVYVVYQRWRLLTGSRNDITYISASKHDSNEIPEAILMFLGSKNTERQVGILSDVWVFRQSKMAAINREITYISASIHDKTTKFQRLNPCFRNRATRLDYCGNCPMCGQRGKSKMSDTNLK